MFKDQIELVGGIHLAGDAVNVPGSHVAGFGVVVDLVAAFGVKVFYSIYGTFQIIQRAYDHDMIGAKIKQLSLRLSGYKI